MSTITPIKVDFGQLVSGTLHPEIVDAVERTFGLDGLGVIVVTNIPDFKKVKERVLTNNYLLSSEPPAVLDSLRPSDPALDGEIGFSAKPFFNPFGVWSNRFISFYSGYPEEAPVYSEDPKFSEDRRNIWPTTVPNFERDLRELNDLMHPCFTGLLKYFDFYLRDKIPESKHGKFHDSFYSRNRIESREIVYTPLEDCASTESDQHEWDNWHTDFGLMASVLHPMYFTKTGDVFKLADSCFAIKDRRGIEYEVNLADDEFMITTGESMFIESAGYVSSVPHTVKVRKDVPRNIFRSQSVAFFNM